MDTLSISIEITVTTFVNTLAFRGTQTSNEPLENREVPFSGLCGTMILELENLRTYIFSRIFWNLDERDARGNLNFETCVKCRSVNKVLRWILFEFVLFP